MTIINKIKNVSKIPVYFPRPRAIALTTMKTAAKSAGRPLPRSPCIPESILDASGCVQTILLDERYAPYARQIPRIENLCGTFTEYVTTEGLDPVVKRTGTQREIFHLHGNVVINQGKGAFMGVRGLHGIKRLARALRLESAGNVVHMAVLTTKLGKRAQVSANGLLETNLERHSEHLRVEGRMYEHTNAVRFTLVKFEAPQFWLPREMQPDNNDWMVTGKGMVIIRLSWRGVDEERRGLAWNKDTEAACLGLCERVTEWIRRCC